MKTRRKFSADFKAKVAIDAIKEIQTLPELSQKYEISVQQIKNWKKEFLSGASSVFEKESKASKLEASHESEKQQLYSKIGQLQVQVDFLKEASLK
ncbi:transposase [Persicobacter diffluens]|uniref:Transposase n=1 Tax=Persicobacter diffluens TaxID=981 RepID=A0AAN5AMC5_9BACT|nr:transposase [Persicobacter diffluens]